MVDRERAVQLVENWRDKRIAVVGDFMLDRYIWGSATRISYEAPVPVVAVERTSAAPGGAANVLRNLASLGARPYAFGTLGDDAAGLELEALLCDLGVVCTGIIREPGRRTTEKSRIVAGGQQVARVDTEDTHPLSETTAEGLVQRLAEAIQTERIDAVILEDYAKGVLTPAVAQGAARAAHAAGVPAALDPHPASQAHAEGLTLMTPNRREAFAMAGLYYAKPVWPLVEDAALAAVQEALQARWRPENLLITLGSAGMALFTADERPLHIPTRAPEVFDVSGAGDTVIASFMLALVGGASGAEAAEVSNHAAGVVVGKVGTAPVSVQELLQAFAQDREP